LRKLRQKQAARRAEQIKKVENEKLEKGKKPGKVDSDPFGDTLAAVRIHHDIMNL